jgi:hypothetical protein
MMPTKYQITEIEDKSASGNYSSVFHHIMFSKKFGADDQDNTHNHKQGLSKEELQT